MQTIATLNKEMTSLFKQLIMKIGKEVVKDFYIPDHLKPIYNNLLLYFTGNEGPYDLDKGIYLYGEYGIGKTVTMKIFSKFLSTLWNFGPNNFGMTSIEQILETLKADGNLQKYGLNWDGDKERPFSTCINELGKTVDEKYYGTRAQSVINSMLMVRYEIFQNRKAMTHATSNYRPSQLEGFDGAILDRFNEMFNFIPVGGRTFRK